MSNLYIGVMGENGHFIYASAAENTAIVWLVLNYSLTACSNAKIVCGNIWGVAYNTVVTKELTIRKQKAVNMVLLYIMSKWYGCGYEWHEPTQINVVHYSE